jgi:hypothetical protein
MDKKEIQQETKEDKINFLVHEALLGIASHKRKFYWDGLIKHMTLKTDREIDKLFYKLVNDK